MISFFKMQATGNDFIIINCWNNIDIKKLREYESKVIKEHQDKIKITLQQ